MGKPRGIRCARKMRNRRRDQRWADLGYKKANLGTALKANPFGGASHAKGIVLEKIGVEAKQPNSAIRKCVRVQVNSNFVISRGEYNGTSIIVHLWLCHYILYSLDRSRYECWCLVDQKWQKDNSLCSK